MNESESPLEAKPLNLHKFVPKPDESTQEIKPEDGHTMMIRRIAAETVEKPLHARIAPYRQPVRSRRIRIHRERARRGHHGQAETERIHAAGYIARPPPRKGVAGPIA